MSLHLLWSEREDKTSIKRCTAREDHERIGFGFVFAWVVSKNPKTPKLSPMGDDAITQCGIGGLVSLVYICGCASGFGYMHLIASWYQSARWQASDLKFLRAFIFKTWEQSLIKGRKNALKLNYIFCTFWDYKALKVLYSVTSRKSEVCPPQYNCCLIKPHTSSYSPGEWYALVISSAHGKAA